MADSEDTPEVSSIKSRIESWLNQTGNKINIDLTNNPINFKRHSNTLFTCGESHVAITLGFKDENLNGNSSLEQFRSNFNFIALDSLPTPGLTGIPPQWNIKPQTPISSFSEGVTLDHYDPHTQILKITVQTRFFAIYGIIPQQPYICDAPSPKGTYLQVRRDIEGFIKVNAKLIFN